MDDLLSCEIFKCSFYTSIRLRRPRPYLCTLATPLGVPLSVQEYNQWCDWGVVTLGSVALQCLEVGSCYLQCLYSDDSCCHQLPGTMKAIWSRLIWHVLVPRIWGIGTLVLDVRSLCMTFLNLCMFHSGFALLFSAFRAYSSRSPPASPPPSAPPGLNTIP
jgi:hypothetical protein